MNDGKGHFADKTTALAPGLRRIGMVTGAVVMLAWLLRHPAGIVPIIGASKPEHIIENCAADRVKLSAEEWQKLFGVAAQIQTKSE